MPLPKDANNLDLLNKGELKFLWESVCGTFINVYENDISFYKKLQDFQPSNNEAIHYIMDFLNTCDPISSLNSIKEIDKEIDFYETMIIKEENEVTEMDLKIANAVTDFIYDNLEMPNY